jgi:signal transduction histidine kinase
VNEHAGLRAEDVAAAMRQYRSGAEEPALLRAYELAREAMGRGVGLLELAADFQWALTSMLSGADADGDPAGWASAAGELLKETLGPFEMAYRGFQEANEALRASLRDREHEIIERRLAEQAAGVAREEADRANRAKSEFLSRMSHELRTPLNAIIGFGRLLQMDELDEGQRESVDQILQGGAHLLDLINELLDIARIESGRISLTSETVDIGPALREAVGLIGPLASERRVAISIVGEHDACLVSADRQRLRQVLLNLLSNAVKYNRQGGNVEVRVELADARLRVDVRDQGPGISPEGLERLFVPFERLDADRSAVEGSGLGLVLSKLLVEAMGGSLGVTSTLGEGSTFTLEFPVADAGRYADPQAGAA